MAHDVFLSYAHQDKPVADALCATLEAHRIRCWMAPRDVAPGAEWAGAISDAIGQSSVFVLIFSDSSNRSRQVIREVGLAVSRGVVVIPLRLEDVPLSSTMEYFVSTCHWLDALTPPLEAHLNSLRSRIQSLLQPADRGSHEASPSQPATPLPSGNSVLETPTPVSDAYRAALQRRLDARKQHRSARLAIGVGALVVVLVLAFALSFGLKAHQRGPAADTGGPGAAQSGPPADTGGPGPAQADSAGDSGGGSEANAAPAWQPERIRTAPTSSDTAAQRERCQSQLKSLARACLMYSMDYDETMPRADWAPAIYPYAMHNYELYKCPVVSDAWGYALDSKVLGRPMAFFYQPAQTALLFDTSANVQSAVADTTGMAYRHLLGANVARVDGSVRWYTADGLAH